MFATCHLNIFLRLNKNKHIMKKTLFALSTIVLLSATILGCKKNDNNTGSWSATASGTSISGNAVTGAESNGIFLVGLTQTSATAYPTISISAAANLTNGTYALNDTSTVQLIYATNTGGSAVSFNSSNVLVSYISSGSITVNISGSTVSGTFNCTAYNAASGDSVVITNGKFSGPWQ